MTGVSFVLPIYNGAPSLAAALDAVLAQDDGSRPFEVLAVDDGSTDASPSILERYAERGVRVLRGPGRGAAAALNTGWRAARHELICQVDQDVLLGPGWTAALVDVMARHPHAAAAQGVYAPRPGAPLVARVAGLDVLERYARLEKGAANPSAIPINHVCTGNAIYCRAALEEVGGFDENFGYGYDNDLAYRLTDAGWHLLHCPSARAVHLWREDLAGYLRQQTGQGHGRLDLVAKHRGRARGDAVSDVWMMLHAPAMLGALTLGALSLALRLVGAPWRWAMRTAGVVVGALAVERALAGARAARQHGTKDFDVTAAWAFAPLHLLRDVAWSWAIVRWTWRRLHGRRAEPGESMRR